MSTPASPIPPSSKTPKDHSCPSPTLRIFVYKKTQLPNPKSKIQNQRTLTIPTYTNLDEEIASLRHTIRRTNRAMRRNDIDPVKAGRLIARATTALIALLNLQRSIEADEEFKSTMARIRAARDATIPSNQQQEGTP